MKKILMIAALVIGTYTITSAQYQDKKNTRPTQEQQAQRQSEGMQKRLMLSDKQKAKVYDVNVTFLKKMEASRTDKNINMHEAQNERHDKLKAIFTKEQYTQWKGGDRPGMRHDNKKMRMDKSQELDKSTNETKKVAK